MEGLIKPAVELTIREEAALEEFRSKNNPPMSPVTAVNFFRLYVDGYTLEQIHNKFKQWSLGMLVDARVRYDWDAKKNEYIDDLYKRAIEKMQKLQLESVDFLTGLATVAHTEFEQENLKYLQNPTKENLPKTRIRSLREYDQLIKTIDSVTKLGRPAMVAPTNIPQQQVNVQVQAGGKIEISGDRSALLRKLAGGVVPKTVDE